MNTAEQLQAFVKSLSEKELRKLAAKVELDRGAPKLGLPHNAIMQLLRPALALIRAPRVFHAQRVFCMPFEDMLVNGKPDPRPAGKIDRSTIQTMWFWFSEDLAKEEYKTLREEYSAAQAEDNTDRVHEISVQLWKLGADRMSPELEKAKTSDKELRDLTKRFGGENRLQDIIEMVGCLRIAATLEETKAHLRPKPMMGLAEPEIFAIKQGYTKVSEEFPGDEVYFLLAMMARLLRPYTIFQVLRTLSRKGDDAMLQKTDMGVVGGVVIDELESVAKKIGRSDAKGGFDEDAMVEDIYFFSHGFKEITDHMGITRDGEWGQRMFKSRSTVSDAIDRKFLRDAEQRIMKALPTKSGGLVPKLAEWPNDQDFEMAERRARAIHDIYILSDHLGNHSACQNVIHKMQKHFDNYTVGLLKALPQAPEELKETCHAYVCIATRLIELILGPEEADLLRRRGNAALNNTMVD